MVKLNNKILLSDKENLNKQWENFMDDVHKGIIDQQKAVYLMERLNCIDRFLIDQRHK